MSNEHTIITDFDFTLIADFFKKMPRQGPGSDEETLRALSFVEPVAPGALVVDLGCGTGAQTRVLAAHTGAKIIAIDFLPQMIEELNRRMTESGFSERVRSLVGSMDDLPFGAEALDLIWAEGSIYNIGYERGLHYWRPFLKPGGFVAVTDVCWLSDARPGDLGFIEENLPEIDTAANKIRIMQEAGYKPVAHFLLPEYCWVDNFYAPMRERILSFQQEENDTPTVRAFVERAEREIDYYMENGAYFGYGFFIGQKI